MSATGGIDAVTKAMITKVIIVVVVLVLAYFMVVKPILKKIGLIESKDDKEREKKKEEFGTSAESPFSPNFYKDKPGAILVKRAEAERLADQIENAIGNWYDPTGDDENAVYGALRQLKAKTQLSFISEVFAQRHSADLYQMLVRNFSDSEMDVINSIADKLE